MIMAMDCANDDLIVGKAGNGSIEIGRRGQVYGSELNWFATRNPTYENRPSSTVVEISRDTVVGCV